MNAVAKIGIYREAEANFLDINDREVQNWLAANYPAIMADRPVNMSEGYQFMPSHRIASILQNDFDMRLVEVGQQFSRSRDPRGQEHFMKFRMPSSLSTLRRVGDSQPELVLMNSHNGRSTIRAYAGVFRLVCSNGMVVSTESFGPLRLRHFGEKNSFAAFRELLNGVARGMSVLDARMELMKATVLTKHQQNQLAKLMMLSRNCPDWVQAKDVLEHHRQEDAPLEDGRRDLWLTFNVIQENLVSRTVESTLENARARQIRPITGARASILTNERLWIQLESFIESNFPRLAKESFEQIEGSAVEVEPETDRMTAQEGDLTISFEDVMESKNYQTFLKRLELTDAGSFSQEQKKKISSRKSYLKKRDEQIFA